VTDIEVAGEPGPGDGGFLSLVRLRYRNVYADGGRSRPYTYEHIHRRGFDAVAIGLFHEEAGRPEMAYRPGIRVPAYFRKDLPLAVPDARVNLPIPEAVAGSLEPSDRGLEGFLGRVTAEVLEEAGFAVRPEDVVPLGGGFFPSHGQSSEKIHLCAVRVITGQRGEAPGDGSVNESDAPPVAFMGLREVLLACAAGDIEDPKLEILAWRLSLHLGYLPLEGRYASGPELEALDEFRRAMARGGWNGRPQTRHLSAR
jgi:ADP-ribose pyrophosphatase